MKQEKENLQRAASAGEYLAPSVKVHEIRTRKVLCASPYETDNEQYGSDNLGGF